MNDFVSEFLDGAALFSLGFGLVLVGVFIWLLSRILRHAFALRVSRAERLREAGEEERAQKIDAETAVLLHRVPLYGRVLVVSGIAVLITGVIRLR